MNTLNLFVNVHKNVTWVFFRFIVNLSN